MGFYHCTFNRPKTFKDLVFKPHPTMGTITEYFPQRVTQALVCINDKSTISIVQGLSLNHPELYEVAVIQNNHVNDDMVWGSLIESQVENLLAELQGALVVERQTR